MSESNELKFLQSLKEDLNESNSSKDKKKVLQEYHEDNPTLTKKWLRYLFSYKKQYHVTSKNLKKNSDLVGDDCPDSIFTLLDMLDNRKVTGHDAIKMVNKFVQENDQYEDLIYNIIDKDIKSRINTKSINKAIPNAVESFNVALANTFEDKRLDDDDWFISRKLDGVRVVGIHTGDDVKFFSRKGKEIHTLGKVRDELLKFKKGGYAFDGEICVVNKDGNEDFQGIMKQIRKKDHEIENPKFYIFDCIRLEEFEGEVDPVDLYTDRLLALKVVLGVIKQRQGKLKYVHPLRQIKFTESNFKKMQEVAAKGGWEGLIIRKNVIFEGKRSYNMLKFKKFTDDEYKVLGIELGEKDMLKDGSMQTQTCVGSLEIEHKGHKVSVGSGLSDEQRMKWKENPDDIIGKVITVCYFEETKNEQGEISLRFPTLKHVHGKEREL